MNSRRFWRYAVILAAVSTAEIALSSPLFATLGFEYSALMALVLSLVCGLYTVNSPSSERGGGWGVVFSRASLFSTIPLVVSLLSLAFIPNCALLDGLVFYAEIAIPSALLGAGFGIIFSMMTKSRRMARWLFVAFWIVTLVLSLLPGYTNPQLYTYGWQYGYFPGLTWDESIELTNAYLIFRIENIAWLLVALALVNSWYLPRAKATRTVLSLSFAMLLIVTIHFNDSVGITTSHDLVARKLNEHIVVGDATVRYRTGSFTSDEVEKITRDVRWYLFDIRSKYHLTEHEPITIYIYPSTEALFDLIGTRTASISKPWLSELHIAKENLHSMKHELAHVLLREKGSWPFYASWSTGLTEGAAMAVEHDYDGIYTLDEHAANILRLGYANGVTNVMAFTGFAANASQKSYVLAGSFSRFLIANYGAERFTHVYSSLSFEKEYGRPLDTLEAEWKRWLAPLLEPLTAEDSLHFRYYYDRASIIFNPCLRRIGKLERNAEKAYHEKRFADAEALFQNAVQEGGGLSPLVMESYVMIHRDNIEGARALLDTTRSAVLRKQRPALYNEKADLRVMLDDSIGAGIYYDSALSVKLSASSFLNSWVSSTFLRNSIGSFHHLLPQLISHTYHGNDSLRALAIDSIASVAGAGRSSFDTSFGRLAANELVFRHRLRKGDLKGALRQDNLGDELPKANPMSEQDSLALAIMQRERLEIGEKPQNRSLCPIRYRRADHEIFEEFSRRNVAGY